MRFSGLVACLGNPGRKYADTRHNIGFMFADALLARARREGAAQELKGGKFNAGLWSVRLPELEGEWLVAKPLTFMNDSGAAVRPILAWHNLEPDQLVVVHDELDLPPGVLRFKYGGGLAGHNGLASISQSLGTRDFYRLRVGIGKPASKDLTLGWVLGRQDAEAAAKTEAIMPYALNALFVFSKKGKDAAVQYAHSARMEI